MSFLDMLSCIVISIIFLASYSFGLNQRHNSRDERDDDDADGVEHVVVDEPQSARHYLEDVEGREDLFDKEARIRLDLHFDRVQAEIS